ncbi:MAG: lytic transglycosylase domain-containing protein [Flavobacteriaceae bacterium]|nr:lytic transglycosylase domain-containing protein [Flavobacteriaceae bacterium]
MRLHYKILILLAIIVISGVLVNATQRDVERTSQNKEKTVYKNTNDTYTIKALKIPDNLSFAGESVPLERHDVKERIDRELLVNTYWQSNALLWLKRTHRYFPVIEPILKEKGVPDDFKYLAVIESDLLNVTSPAGAKGMWQMLKGAARENGLEVNDNVDERYHLEKATRAACDYLISAKKRLGSWTLAAGAYHAGNHGIDRRMETQLVDNYWDVLAGEMTERYVPRIIAAKEILSNPKKYGFHFDKEDLYTLPKSYPVKVDTPITNIAVFAKKYGTHYKELKIHNPWLRENKLNNKSRKVYYIRIPER